MFSLYSGIPRVRTAGDIIFPLHHPWPLSFCRCENCSPQKEHIWNGSQSTLKKQKSLAYSVRQRHVCGGAFPITFSNHCFAQLATKKSVSPGRHSERALAHTSGLYFPKVKWQKGRVAGSGPHDGLPMAKSLCPETPIQIDN